MIRNINKVNTEPVVLPVSVADFKEWANISFSDHDTLIERLLLGSVNRLEHFCGISLVEKTITLHVELDGFYELPYGPVVSVASVHTVASDNEEDELTVDDDYYLTGTGFQSINSYSTGLHKIIYETGYTEVPEDLKEAILSEVAYRYEHRGDELKGGISEEALSLAFPYQRVRV